MTPDLEAIADMLFGEPSENDLAICMAEILPAVRKLTDQGICPRAIIEALANATAAAISSDVNQFTKKLRAVL